jgi:hypothetical protein
MKLLERINYIKNYGKKSETTMINLTNLLLRIWDHDNSTKRKTQKTITKYQIMNLKKKSIFNKGLPYWKETTKKL